MLRLPPRGETAVPIFAVSRSRGIVVNAKISSLRNRDRPSAILYTKEKANG
jgi:hypothetical protein